MSNEGRVGIDLSQLPNKLIPLGIGFLMFAFGFLKSSRIKKLEQRDQTSEEKLSGYDNPDEKGINTAASKQKTKRKIFGIIMVLGAWLSVSALLTMIFGSSKEELEVDIWARHYDLGSISVSESVIGSWIVIGVSLILGLIFRFAVVPKFSYKPKGMQNIFEIICEKLSQYTESTSEVSSASLSCYMLSVALLMIGSAVLEMFGFRAPTSDLVMTISLALISSIFINYFGIRKKGFIGRIKSMAEPTPVVFIFELIGQVSKPISLACRLFGNMLGGMIVIDLLYVALGRYSVGIPAVFGLYFNLFHPLIQAYIFITLSLTFIREAVE